MTDVEQKHSGKYLKMRGKGGIPYKSYLMLVLGVGGLLIFSMGILELIFIDGASFDLVMTGGLLSFLIVVSFFRSGIELDVENKRFREFEGILGRTKDPWIDVEDGDYLSIVGSIVTRAAEDHTPVSTRSATSKVYFWSGDWHLEIFQGRYRESLAFAEKFGDIYNLPINDVNKDQDLPDVAQTSF